MVGGCGRPGASRGVLSFSLRSPPTEPPSVIDFAYWPGSNLRRCLLSRRCSRDQVVMRRMEGDADRAAAGGDIPIAEEMEGIRRPIGRVRLTAFRGKPVP